jgi:hypothetical protein
MTSTLRPVAQTTATSHRPTPWTIKGLATLLGLLTIGSVQGGVAMIVDPQEPLGMSTDHLEAVPIDTYFWPGVFLVCLALASLVTAIGLLTRWNWGWARSIESAARHRWPWIGALATGTVLLTFEIIELFVVPFHPIMHPLLIGIALVIIGLTLTASARTHLAAT